MAKFSKKIAADIKKAIVAYCAYHEHKEAGEFDRAFIYGKMVRDVAHIYAAVDMPVNAIIAWTEHQIEAKELTK